MFEKANDLDLDIVEIERPQLHNPLQRGARELHLMDYTDHAVLMPLVRSLHAEKPFDALVCLTEPGLPTAAAVAAELGLRFTSRETVRLLRDKWAMRQLLEAHGVSPVRAAAGTAVAEIVAFLSGVACPAILKPVDGGGSLGVVLLRSPGEAEAALARLQGLGVRAFIIEEYLTGPEISVEAFSFAGDHVIVTCTEKIVVEEAGFVELGHALPAQLDPLTRTEVEALVRQLLDLVGYTDGPSHTELKLTPQGPRIIEGHDRGGGGRLNELVLQTYGVDFVATTFAWACGLMEPFSAPQARGATAIRFFAPPAGRLRALRGLDELRTLPDVVEVDWSVAVGDMIPGARATNHGRIGHVLVRGPDTAGAVAAAARYAERVEIVVEPELSA